MKIAPRAFGLFVAVTALTVGSLTGAAAAPVTRGAVAPVVAVAPAASHHRTQRVCGDRLPGHMACLAIRQVDPTEPTALTTAAVAPAATPSGYGPANLASAYKLSASGGAGRTVAIVDAYNDPSAAGDLAAYRSQFGLAACTVASGCFRQVNQSGAASPLPTGDTGWAGEISLDLDMVSAVCPACHILLVEASSASDADLYAAVDRAVTMGATFVSNSWGGAEYAAQTTDDSHFDHAGVAITVSSGDDATGAEYPATSRYVTAVGGTHLVTASNARGWTETAWSDAGSGCSAYDAKPSWQTVTTSCAKRAESDVSAVADPQTGVAVYQTYGGSGWTVYGGTSVAAPVIAAVYALAGTPAAGTYPASYPYSHANSLFDVTSGTNGTCGAPICTAGTGWDGPTGLGTPNGTAAFVTGGTTAGLTLANPGTQAAAKGRAVTLALAASGGTTPYTWSATGLPAGLTIKASTGVVSGTPTTTGSSTVTVTVKDAAVHTASATFTWTVTAATACTSSQLLANPGFETGSAAPWTSTAGVVTASGSGETAHAGSDLAWLDGYGSTHTDTLTQSVTVPAACTASTLSFYLHVDTAETGTTAYDKLTVKVGSTTEATYSNASAATGYQLRSFDVGAFAGQTVTVSFSGVEDASLQTSFVLDDTALTTH